jgi:pimeloyl-ACP methyl ester carboxylesterase
MRRWAGWYGKGPGHVHGVSYDEIRRIALPTLVSHGFDPVHPGDSAEELFRLIPCAEWVEYSDKYTAEEMDQAGNSWGLALPFIEEFVDRVEAHTERAVPRHR